MLQVSSAGRLPCLLLQFRNSFNCKNYFVKRVGLFCVNKSTTHSLPGESEDFVNSDDIVTRTLFPESWLWEEVVLPKCSPLNRQW